MMWCSPIADLMEEHCLSTVYFGLKQRFIDPYGNLQTYQVMRSRMSRVISGPDFG
jgi:hypothetical protein